VGGSAEGGRIGEGCRGRDNGTQIRWKCLEERKKRRKKRKEQKIKTNGEKQMKKAKSNLQ
jgi:hypothetical protein